MSLHVEFYHLRNLTLDLDAADPATRRDIVMREILETGGAYVSPHSETSHLFEIQLHGITGRGGSEDLAIASWIGAAQCQIRHTFDPAQDVGTPGAA